MRLSEAWLYRSEHWTGRLLSRNTSFTKSKVQWLICKTDIPISLSLLSLVLCADLEVWLLNRATVFFLSSSEDQETLLSLSTKMSTHQKELAELPGTLKVQPLWCSSLQRGGSGVTLCSVWRFYCKVYLVWTVLLHLCSVKVLFVFQMYPHPDVVECCLVLLHFSQLSPSFPDSLQQEAKNLLHKYGTSPSVLKASRRFLIWLNRRQFGTPPAGVNISVASWIVYLHQSKQKLLRCVFSDAQISTSVLLFFFFE